MKNTFVIILILILGFDLKSQNESVYVIARPAEDKIMLRWAPSNSIAWELGNKYGYTVERYTMMRDGQPLENKEFAVLSPRTIRPKPQANWEHIIDKNDFAAVAAQAIFGEKFELDTDVSDVFQIAQLTQERDQRFSFALFACDQSFETAQLAGLGAVDYEARPNETYLYRVFSNIPASTYPLDTGMVYLNNAEIPPLPKIQNLSGEFGDKTVLIYWDNELTDRFYNAFIIERSEDGKSFKSITKEPIINAYKEEKSNKLFKIDTLENNSTKYLYRIYGISPFGEKGPASEIMSGKGKPSLNAIVAITEHTINPDESTTIKWKFPENKEKLIDGFKIKVARKQSGPYSEISSELIKKNSRQFIIENPISAGYYQVSLVIGSEELNSSFPYLIQLEDSIAPAPPRNVIATIDSIGQVSIKWTANGEEDLMGYRVLRSNFMHAEFSEVTTNPLTNPFFNDTLSLNTLSEKIYYKILAVDNRDNRSEASSIVELSKPDLIPPAPPIFKSMESRQKGAWLSWAKSSSLDVIGYRVYRSLRGNSWELLTDTDSTSHLDTSIPAGSSRYYTIVAYDDRGLESKPIRPVRVGRLSSPYDLKFKRFTVRAERENKRIVLFWRLDGEADKVKIYRSIEDEPLSLYKIIDSNDQYTDIKVIQNVRYTYQLQGVNSKGKEGGFSEKKEIKL